jgi:hypothetical protein
MRGIMQLGREPDLALEARRTQNSCAFAVQHFDGDLAIMLGIMGQMHYCHAAAPISPPTL